MLLKIFTRTRRKYSTCCRSCLLNHLFLFRFMKVYFFFFCFLHDFELSPNDIYQYPKKSKWLASKWTCCIILPHRRRGNLLSGFWMRCPCCWEEEHPKGGPHPPPPFPLRWYQVSTWWHLELEPSSPLYCQRCSQVAGRKPGEVGPLQISFHCWINRCRCHCENFYT